MSDDLDLSHINFTATTTCFCTCGALITPAAVREFVDNAPQWVLYDQCQNFEDDGMHTRTERDTNTLLSSRAA